MGGIIRGRALIVALAFLHPASITAAADLFAADCLEATAPVYPAAGAAPIAKVWKQADGPPPKLACIAHQGSDSGAWVTVAGTFRDRAERNSLLERFGQIGALTAVKYWSTTEQAWRPLFVSATALTQQSGGVDRNDFTLPELQSGDALYLEQADSRSTRKVVYEMKVLALQPHGFVVSTVNVSPVQWWGMTLYKPGDLSSVYFLEQMKPDEWHFYSLSRTGTGSHLLSAKDNSYINRAVALYRYFVGIPTDLEPPAAK